MAPGSPHLRSTVDFCLSRSGSTQGPQLTCVVYEMKGPRGGTQAQKGQVTWNFEITQEEHKQNLYLTPAMV